MDVWVVFHLAASAKGGMSRALRPRQQILALRKSASLENSLRSQMFTLPFSPLFDVIRNLVKGFVCKDYFSLLGVIPVALGELF